MQSSVKLLDGGFSSQISFHLHKDAEYTNHPLWCARFLSTNPTAVINTHRDYVRAGSDIITTNTYQASTEGFQKYLQLSADESITLMKDSVQYARQAIYLERLDGHIGPDKIVSVAGSVGSYGACLHDGSEYNGSYIENISMESVKNWHRPRISALVDAGVDFLAFETIPSVKEASLLVELLKEFPNQKAWVSFTCKNSNQTCIGDDIGNAAAKLMSMDSNGQLYAIGVNCLHPSLVAPLITRIQQTNPKASVGTIAYPNSGEIFDEIKRKWIKQENTPRVDSYVTEWLNLGMSVIGGCCRTTAKDISQFKQLFPVSQS